MVYLEFDAGITVWPKQKSNKSNSPIPNDVDPAETAEWLESLHYVLETQGPGARAAIAYPRSKQAAIRHGVELPFTATTPYVNTIPPTKQPPYPGNREIERRIKSIIRWNAMAMVVRANRDHRRHRRPYFDVRLGRHAVRSGFNHFFRGRGEAATPAIRFTSRGTPRRAFTPARFSKAD